MTQFQESEIYECVKSESPGYKLGKRYKAYKNDKFILCLKGSDGYEDPCENLISQFRKAAFVKQEVDW